MTLWMRACVVVLVALGMSSAALARTKKGKRPKTPRDPLSSAMHRESIEYEAFINPTVFTDRGVGVGGGLGVMVTDDLWLEAAYAAATTGKNATGAPRYDTNIGMLRMKCFLGNSFYVQAGVGERDMAVHVDPATAYTVQNANSVNRGAQYSLLSRTLGSVAGIGNQWQWQHFTIGGEWAGVYTPFQIAEASAAGAADRTQAMALGKQGTTLVMGLMLGYSF